MLQIQHLTIVHRKDLRVIVSDFNFVLNDGDRAVIIGEEGNGKSTLLKWICDPGMVEAYAECTGTASPRQRLGYVAQELTEAESRMTACEYMAAAPSFWARSPAEVGRIAGQLRLKPEALYSDQRMADLSGGEKVKMQFARMLMDEPDAYLLDEPSGDLDILTLEWLERFLLQCERPVLFVSHDETLIERTANCVVHLELVRRKTLPRWTVARMPYRDYMARRQSALEAQRQQARKEREEYDQKMERYRQIRDRVDHQQAAITRQDPHGGRLLKKKMHAVQSMGRRFDRERERMTQLPDVEDALFVRFPEDATVPAGKTVLDFRLDALCAGGLALARDVRLRVRGPRKVCIVGRNGAGKTTLLRRIAGELLARTDLRAAYMPQNYQERLDMAVTPVEFLNRSGDREEATRIRSYLGSVRYTPDEMEHPIAELSGGQKAKLLFVQMALEGCDVLLLDEPTRNFSPVSNPVIRAALRDFGGAIISVSHDRKYIAEVCDAVYELTPEGLRPVRGGE